MNDKITLQQQSNEADAAGQVIGGWVDVTTVWADVKHESGAQVLRNGLPVSTVRVSIMIRARSDVTSAMRAVYEGKAFDVKAVLPNDRDRRFMFLVCEAAE